MKLANTDEINEDTETPTAAEHNNNDNQTAPATLSTNPKMAVVDGIVLIQKVIREKKTLGTVKDLAEILNDRLTSLTEGFNEVILVFDTYKPDSLKDKTRERRLQGKSPTQYKITADTNIKHIPPTRFLTHEKN